jgi:hypothetical protein
LVGVHLGNAKQRIELDGSMKRKNEKPLCYCRNTCQKVGKATTAVVIEVYAIKRQTGLFSVVTLGGLRNY